MEDSVDQLKISCEGTKVPEAAADLRNVRELPKLSMPSQALFFCLQGICMSQKEGTFQQTA